MKEQQTIRASILFQLSCKYVPSSIANPKALIFNIASIKKIKLKIVSNMSKMNTDVYPFINVSITSLIVDNVIIISIIISITISYSN